MTPSLRPLALILLPAAAFAQSGTTPPATAPSRTALDRYVAAPDPNYSWSLVSTVDGGKYRAYVLEMTSQQWLTDKEIDKPVWKHWLTIIRPSQVVGTTGFLFITGGSNASKPPSNTDVPLAEMAVTSNSVVAELRMVPNQPVKFVDAEKATSEDATIAYTWDKFLKTGDEKWPLRLPMTKAAVRAMDTVTAFVGSDAGGRATVDKYVVAGGSKRGWTTWTSAVVDKRVVAIVPLVIDMLNLEKSFVHHWRAYGFWAPAVGDYVNKDLMSWMGTPQYRALMKIEEPYEYRDRLTMPKLIVNAAGDQFFLPDSSQFYWDDLTGEKHLRYVPNADHSLRGSDAAASMGAFYDMVLAGRPRPKYSWKIEGDQITVECADQPTEVKLWQATNEKARDFRLMTIGPAYKAITLPSLGGGRYVAKLTAPEKGFTASFVELTFSSGMKYPLKVTTGVKVMPDTYPFAAPNMRGSGN